jgi:hypothetical protein
MKQMAARYRLLAVLAAGVLLLVAGASSRCPTTGRSSAVRGQRLRGRGNKLRNDRWVFGDPASDAYLVKFSWTDIVRHVMVTGAASPDDPALADYWAERRRKVKPRWTITPCACSPGRMRAVRSAGITWLAPDSRRSPRTTGNNGGNRSPVRR